nr:solute carrier family 46 member 3 isoform X3 [Vicugna pacos]
MVTTQAAGDPHPRGPPPGPAGILGWRGLSHGGAQAGPRTQGAAAPARRHRRGSPGPRPQGPAGAEPVLRREPPPLSLWTRKIPATYPSNMQILFVEPAICLSAFAMSLAAPLTTQYVYRRIWEETGNYSIAPDSNISECAKNKSSPIFAFQEEI